MDNFSVYRSIKLIIPASKYAAGASYKIQASPSQGGAHPGAFDTVLVAGDGTKSGLMGVFILWIS